MDDQSKLTWKGTIQSTVNDIHLFITSFLSNPVLLYNAFTAIFLTFKTKDFATDNNGFEIVTKNKIVERNY